MRLSHKITITLFFAIVAPLLVPIFLLFKDISEFQQKSLLILLSSISSGLVPSLTFESKEGAEVYLQDTITNIPGVFYAAVYTKDGALFAEWKRNDLPSYPIDTSFVNNALREEIVDTVNGNIVVGVPIFETSDSKESIGTLLVVAKKQSVAGKLLTIFLSVGAISSVIFIVAFMILRGVSREINLIVKEISKSSEGDIRSLPLYTKDEIGQIAVSWNNLVSKLKSVVSSIVSHAKDIEEISSRLSSGSTELSQSVHHQIDNLTEIAKAIKEFSETLKGIAERMKSMSETAKASFNVAKIGADSSRAIGQTMEKFSLTMNEVIQTFRELSGEVLRINQIADTVRDIAERTNLLSLNAAIEAARAGESGRGFAVVAQEVGELASKTNEELAKIEEVTETILGAVNKVRENFNRMGEVFKEVKDRSDNMKHDFDNILSKSEETSKVVKSVSEDVNNHLKTIEDISERVNLITQANEEIGAMALELSRVAEEVRTVSEKLYGVVEFFKIQTK